MKSAKLGNYIELKFYDKNSAFIHYDEVIDEYFTKEEVQQFIKELSSLVELMADKIEFEGKNYTKDELGELYQKLRDILGDEYAN